jgi:uncharacterized protein YukE
MAGMLGADPDELDALAQRFRVLAGRLDSSRASLGAQIHNSPWAGPAAEGFRHDWDGHHTRVLSGVARSLGQAAESLTRNANEQRHASGSASASGSGGVPTSTGSGTFSGIADALGHGVEVAAVFGSITTLLANSDRLLQVPFSKLSADSLGAMFKNGEQITSKNKALSGISLVGVAISGTAFLYDMASGQSIETTTLDAAQVVGAGIGILSPGVGAAVGDGAKFFDDLYAKKSVGQTVWDGANLVADGVGTFVPPVLLGKEALIGGMAIGSFIAEIPAVKSSISDFNDDTFAAGVKAVGGDPYSDPEAAARLASRYSSDPVGFGNYLFDSGSAFFTKIGIH